MNKISRFIVCFLLSVVIIPLVYGQSEDLTPLLRALDQRDLSRAKSLLQAGADPNIGFNGVYPIMLAALIGNLDLLKLIIDSGANVNAQKILSSDENSLTLTALTTAIDANKSAVVSFLLLNDAEVSLVGNGWSPLTLAVKKNRLEITSILLNHGANPNERDGLGVTPLEWARKEENYEMINLLQNARTNSNIHIEGNDTLTKIETEIEKLLDKLFLALVHSSQESQIQSQIVSIGKPAVPFLLEHLLQDNNPFEELNAKECLIVIGEPAITLLIDQLIAFTNSPSISQGNGIDDKIGRVANTIVDIGMDAIPYIQRRHRTNNQTVVGLMEGLLKGIDYFDK